MATEPARNWIVAQDRWVKRPIIMGDLHGDRLPGTGVIVVNLSPHVTLCGHREMYERLFDLLIPDVFASLSAALVKQLRHFAKQLEPWHETIEMNGDLKAAKVRESEY